MLLDSVCGIGFTNVVLVIPSHIYLCTSKQAGKTFLSDMYEEKNKNYIDPFPTDS